MGRLFPDTARIFSGCNNKTLYVKIKNKHVSLRRQVRYTCVVRKLGPKYSKENIKSQFHLLSVFYDETGCFSGGGPADFLSCSSCELCDIIGD